MISKQIYNNMKKIILIAFLGLILATAPAYALGNALQVRDAKVASRAAVITQVQVNISQDLRNRAQAEITRRLSFLNELITKLNSIKKISSVEKTDLQSQIQTQIDGLNALQTKINGDTDNTTLKVDVKSIVGNYYIYLFFRVKVNLLITGDRGATTFDNLSQIYTKLQIRISQAKANGNDVSNLNTFLSDMNAKLTDANTQINAAQTELTPLAASGYPASKSTLEDARTKIKAAVTDLKDAYKDALQIRQGLEGLRVTNPGASTSAH